MRDPGGDRPLGRKGLDPLSESNPGHRLLRRRTWSPRQQYSDAGRSPAVFDARGARRAPLARIRRVGCGTMIPARTPAVTVGARDIPGMCAFYRALGWEPAVEMEDFAAFET